jgi:hypothetical protein
MHGVKSVGGTRKQKGTEILGYSQSGWGPATTHPRGAGDFRPSPRAALTAHAVSTGQRTRARIVDEGPAAQAAHAGKSDLRVSARSNAASAVG